MGSTCKPMAVSFQCMTKSTTIKKNSNNLKKNNLYQDPVLKSVHLYLEGNNGASTTNFKGFRQLQFEMRFSASVSLLVCFSRSVVSNSLRPHGL